MTIDDPAAVLSRRSATSETSNEHDSSTNGTNKDEQRTRIGSSMRGSNEVDIELKQLNGK